MLKKIALILVTILGLQACVDDTQQSTIAGQAAERIGSVLNGRLMINLPASTTRVGLINFRYQSASTNTSQTTLTGVTNTSAQFKYYQQDKLSFTLFNQNFGPIDAKALITEADLAASYCTNVVGAASNCVYTVTKNLQRALLSADNDLNASTGIRLASTTPLPNYANLPTVLHASQDVFEAALAKQLALYNRQPLALFKPSLAINVESPQPEADDVGGQPAPFADIFRIARPFKEYSCTDISYDTNGWPTKIPASCATQNHAVLKVPSYATAIMLQGVPVGAIPLGKYTVLYEGSGTITYYGIANKIAAESTANRDVIEVTSVLMNNVTTNRAGLRLTINSTNEANPVKNIRVIMPGGICSGNVLVRVDNATQCASGKYLSFETMLKANRNNVVFNPDYLRFLKDFKVLRMMNFMEASPRNPCYTLTGDAYKTCLLQEFTWGQRAQMNQATWGGSARTSLLERYARGVPLEVAVALANQLNRDPWFNIPHNATAEYISNYATYVRDNLKATLKAHIEYSNETWNGIFWASLYVREKGKDLDTNGYRAGYKYYSNRSVEIFKEWARIFGGTNRLVRVLNTYNLDEWGSRNMLAYNGNATYVDVLASAPYFYGCWSRAASNGTPIAACSDTVAIPKVVKEAVSVDDIFSIIDNVNDPYGMAKTIYWLTRQAVVANEFTNDRGKKLDFYTYEGGQHLTIDYSHYQIPSGASAAEIAQINAEIARMQSLIRGANRDPRMGERYTQLLNAFKANGGKLFTLFTMPQSYHKFGTFGIKEHLNQERSAAPKYDKAMQFQETVGNCWWTAC
ncbi:hypothetical protein [Thiolinea disciformis]|uniref:hypothetical protein n=1 Tax=Thiolinea disciformis TaxID=125614 RepID=UPI00052678B2|nr:hypothetical protein [Thiolinea disciformis]